MLEPPAEGVAGIIRPDCPSSHLRYRIPTNVYKVVLLRHGESTWNKENRFTGWTDVDLTERGVAEAQAAGELLRREGYAFDLAYTSVLKRANKTLNIVLEKLDALWLPVEHSWRLNERHYGALQGLNKGETAARYGDDPIPRPAWWGGYLLAPDVVELWESRTDRLHDRIEYRRRPGGGWDRRRLQP